MLFFDKSQLLILLAFMLMIDVVDCFMLISSKPSIWTVSGVILISSFIVADAIIAYDVATDKS